MPTRPEPQPEPATDRCPPRYRTRRQAERGAYWLATKRSEKPQPVRQCEGCAARLLAAAIHGGETAQ